MAARRRGNGIFCSASVAHVDDDEKLLPNGDYYSGDWLGRLPHGRGKYLWTDGCMYDGEWYKGRTMGKGRFCWPSGATYEGEFNDGFMDGNGTYTAPSGDTYKGRWSMNLKHGHGTKAYVKGDDYEGEWQQGLRHGHGRYRWKNGNCYIGQWKNGVISGSGTMMWSNGDRYDGFWEDGLPKGTGTFRRTEKKGPYCDSVSTDGIDIGGDPRTVFDAVRPAENVRALDRVVDEDDGFERPKSHSHVGTTPGRWQLRIGRVKRQGEPISKGHKNYELMLNLQLGIRHSVSRPGPDNPFDLDPLAFDPKEKMRTRFPSEGSKHTPSHQSCEFRWKDYCPAVFRALRKLLEIDEADYMISLCGDDALRELSSPGKSGSFFYLAKDDQYMIKTIKKAEVKSLLRMLPAYYQHVLKHQNTLLTKFFGLHCVKLTGATQKKVRFVIMGNVFCSQNAIHQCFDLKGSSHGRIAEKPETAIGTSTPLKDLDLNFLFRLQNPDFHEFRRQVDIDCVFLEQERIMDYSLLVGLHFRNLSHEEDAILACPVGSREDVSIGEVISSDAPRNRPLGANMAARAELRERPVSGALRPAGKPSGEMYNVSISFGIIDILQNYDISKKLEHAYKSMQYDPALISAVDPRQYSRRFHDFILKVFVEDT